MGRDGEGRTRRLFLTYHGVVSFCSTDEPDDGLPGSLGYGDLGYDEIDLTDDGFLEYRMLFSSGIELQVVFAGFEFAWVDGENA